MAEGEMAGTLTEWMQFVLFHLIIIELSRLIISKMHCPATPFVIPKQDEIQDADLDTLFQFLVRLSPFLNCSANIYSVPLTFISFT